MLSFFQILASVLSLASLAPNVGASVPKRDLRYIMYLTGQHNVVPEDKSLTKDLTHVALAFMHSTRFNVPNATEFPLFTTIPETRARFPKKTAIMVAIGGWGDTEGFSAAAKTEQTRALFAENVKRMLDQTGADGVDVDWEYPGGNGEDYKKVTNVEKAWEVAAYPLLLRAIREAIGPKKIISSAVPALVRDLIAFTPENMPSIAKSVDFLNVMTYDMFNRRDNITKHHTGVSLSLTAVDTYVARGLPRHKANLGFAFYVRWGRTVSDGRCKPNPIGCPTLLAEDPVTGGDLGNAGSFAWHDPVPKEFAVSFAKAQKNGKYDKKGGGYYYWDEDEAMWWSWDTPQALKKKFPEIVESRRMGGVFAWGLGEDAPEFKHLKATSDCVSAWNTGDEEHCEL